MRGCIAPFVYDCTNGCVDVAASSTVMIEILAIRFNYKQPNVGASRWWYLRIANPSRIILEHQRSPYPSFLAFNADAANIFECALMTFAQIIFDENITIVENIFVLVSYSRPPVRYHNGFMVA